MTSINENANNSLNESIVEGYVFVYDRRKGDSAEITVSTAALFTFQSFKEKIRETFQIGAEEKYVITNTSRKEIHDDETWHLIENGDTLYILEDTKQELPAAAQERVNYIPHYDTIVKGGMYEYYASEGQNPLAYAFAELIDNALAATADNLGPRKIEIRLHLDESQPNKNTIFVIDNGKGMSSRQLNNWAIYRLSKFIRKDRRSLNDSNNSHEDDNDFVQYAPRSLNSDISYFGVGGKQAIFFIGDSTRMITKPKNSCDVHELHISKEEFERREHNKESIYSGFIRNRQPADSSHIPPEEEHLRNLIEEEMDQKHFTFVTIQNINPEHLRFIKTHFSHWTRQLAHIYHYYIYGPNGNDLVETEESKLCSKIEIIIKLKVKGMEKLNINLRDIKDDMQSQYIQSSADTFEFKCLTTDLDAKVEGLIRYHPFLYDHETFPYSTNETRMVEPDPEDDHDYTNSDVRPARGRRPMFECFWNGRLIPYTTIDDFDWCSGSKKSKQVPLECFNRCSGVLWSNDKFQVSTNKLTFTDLEIRLKEKSTSFCRVIGKNEKRTDIGREFFNWLKDCHENFDKQIKFCQPHKSPIVRTELSKSRQSPWTGFNQIEWDGKIYAKNQLVKIKTLPNFYGSISKFLLFGSYDDDVYATGGEIEVTQEPKTMYTNSKTFPLTKLDRVVNIQVINKHIDEELSKLPKKLQITWPEGNEVMNGEKIPVGNIIGDIKVEILSRKGDLIKQLPGSREYARKLLVELKVIWHGSGDKDELIASHICPHGRTWPYWFKAMDNIKQLGSYTLSLTVVTEAGGTHSSKISLPSEKIKFTVVEGEAKSFRFGILDGPFKIGVPFQVPLEFFDLFGNITKPLSNETPSISASGLDITFEDVLVKDKTLILKNAVATGKVNSLSGKDFDVTVNFPSLEKVVLKMRMLPGSPYTVSLSNSDIDEKIEIKIENGESLTLNAEVHDAFENLTAKPKLNLTCKFLGSHSLPDYVGDCSASGLCTLTGVPLQLKSLKKQTEIPFQIELNGVKPSKPFHHKLIVVPSKKVSKLKLTYTKDEKTEEINSGDELTFIAGEIIEDIAFKLFDESGAEKEVDNSLASHIKVNWTAKLVLSTIISGKLPDIKVPSRATESKYCLVSLTDNSAVQLSFNIKVIPGDADCLKCAFSDSSSLRLGEPLKSDIIISVNDKHGNLVAKLDKNAVKELQVSADGLLTSDIKTTMHQESGFKVSGVKFDSGPLGSREISLIWGKLKEFVRVDLLPGPPAKLIIPNCDSSQPVSVYNETKLPFELTVQLLDAAGNSVPEKSVRVQLAKDPNLKLIPSPVPTKTNQNGLATFGFLTAQAKRGVYEIQPKAFIGQTVLSAPKIKINVQLDPTKIDHLFVEYDQVTEVGCGEPLPEFSVKILTIEDRLVSAAKSSSLTMKVWNSNDSADLPTHNFFKFVPDSINKNSQAGRFYFSKHKAPELAGPYSFMFIYKEDKIEISSPMLKINVLPGDAVKIVPLSEVGTPTVSNTKKLETRTLLRNIKFELQDKFDNFSGESYNGLLKATVVSPGKNSETPMFHNNTDHVLFGLRKGRAIIHSLTIQENTQGKDGEEYILRLAFVSGDESDSPSQLSFDIPFFFYNDVKKQSQMAALSKERDSLVNAIKTYKSLFETTQQLIDELKASYEEAKLEEFHLKTQLKLYKINSNQISTEQAVVKLIHAKSLERDRVKDVRRRMCGLAPAQKSPEILGKIAHLAEVKDNDIARVLSWHMSADMDCVVTMTSKKAKEIYSQSSGRQQVLPLDLIFKRNLPDWDKPLPHVRLRPVGSPKGNPVYARNLLHFPNDSVNCKIVFGMLLGDTIIVDTLDHANAYRQLIVQHTHCPTILTREGDRIRSNGKFGGLMNKALPIEKLRGAVFAEPIAEDYYNLASQIDLLQNYLGAMAKRQTAHDELEEQISGQQTPEMKVKLSEFKEAETQLQSVEQRLGRSSISSSHIKDESPVSKTTRPSPTASDSSPANSKRPRLSTGSAASTPANGSSTITPTRQSSRRSASAGVTFLMDEMTRKRSRRT